LRKKQVPAVNLITLVKELSKKWKISEKAAGEMILEFVEITLNHVRAGHTVELHGLGVLWKKHYLAHSGGEFVSCQDGKTYRSDHPEQDRVVFRETTKLKKYFVQNA
jgi:nucleoid DNA-binding protein